MDAREFALKVISEVELKGAYANIVLARELTRHSLADQDRRFATELIYGVIKTGETLDWIVGHYCTRPLAKIDSPIRNILRLGMYQLFFLTRVPPSAACNESVKLAKKYGHVGTVKFVNAVLRNATREPDKVRYPDPTRDEAAYLSLLYYHPRWLVARWLQHMDSEVVAELCRCNNMTPPLSLRTNTLKIDRHSLQLRLEEEGVSCFPSSLVPEGLVCSDHPALAKLPSLAEGLVQVQDESSMLVSHVLAPQSGEFVIDACGAPGGKSTHIAALMKNQGRVLSTDIHSHKLAITAENAARLGITIIETVQLDATALHTVYAGQADRVLVDAPCSGLGVLRRKPDSRWRKTEDTLRELPPLQEAILTSAAACVKPGGVLVYSTCTTEKEENQEVVKAFLEKNSDFSLETTGHWLPVKREEDMVQLWPHVDHTDGFFIARMVRQS